MKSQLKDLMLFSTLTGLLMTLGSLVSSRHPATRQPHRRIGRGLEIVASQARTAIPEQTRRISRRTTAGW